MSGGTAGALFSVAILRRIEFASVCKLIMALSFLFTAKGKIIHEIITAKSNRNKTVPPSAETKWNNGESVMAEILNGRRKQGNLLFEGMI